MFISKCTFSMAAIALLTLLAGCGSSPDNDSSVFRYRLASDPPTLDPIHTTDTSSATVVFKLFEGLVEQDPATLEVVSALAEKWEISNDGLTYIFHLKKGVTFHNGREVTSADFRYSFERCLAPTNRSERSWVLAPIKGASEMLAGKAPSLSGMETPDNYTVILNLEKPFAPFLSYLSMEAARVVAHEGVVGDTFTPIGTGPFKFISWDHDIRVSLEAFDEYHSGKSGIKRVDFEVIPDVGVAFQKFISGELDLVNEIPPGQLKLIKERYPDAVRVWSYLRIEYIGINQTRPPFKNNLKLRQALCWAVDRKRISEDLLEGASLPATSILPPGIMGRDDTIEGYGFDLEKARLLLAEAGYPDGSGLPELTLWYNTNETHQQVAQFIQSTFKKIGVSVRLKSLDWPAYLKACESHEPDLYRLGWVADIPDADNFLYILLHSSQIGPAGNYSGYTNPVFDRLVEEARLSTDTEHRIELYRKADRLATEEACWIMYAYPMQQILFNPDYEGLVLPKQGDFRIPLEKLRLKTNI
ncbi:MAG TPA: ABC transporter substrate-binding protein [Anaerolineae bacterium]|nr:ABC transporter substrate-binding protein [Anaerolineae bacterium]